MSATSLTVECVCKHDYREHEPRFENVTNGRYVRNRWIGTPCVVESCPCTNWDPRRKVEELGTLEDLL